MPDPRPEHRSGRGPNPSRTIAAELYWEPGFGSAHTGVMNAVFGDGSVRSVRMSIGTSGNKDYNDSTSVLYRLCRRDDGATVNPGDF